MSALVRRLIDRWRKTPQGEPKIKKGLPFTRLKHTEEMFFETEFFKYNAKPQYLIHYWLEQQGLAKTPKWSCTCPDFVNRKGPQHKMCKHCQAVAMLARANTSPFIAKHLRVLTKDIYYKMIAMPIGQPLPILPNGAPTKRLRITIADSEPGYIAYISRRFICYTCGGPAGVQYLKGRQCKHIACYSKSLNDDDYKQYCHIMPTNMFRTAVQQQQRNTKTAWQRF